MREAVLKKQEKIAAMVMAEQMDKSEAEEKVMKKAIAEKEAVQVFTQVGISSIKLRCFQRA